MFYNENCGDDAPNQIIYYENNVSNKKDLQLSPKLRLKMTTWLLTVFLLLVAFEYDNLNLDFDFKQTLISYQLF